MRSLIDSDEFRNKVADVPDWDRLDDALLGLYCSIARKAEAFPDVDPARYPGLKIAKTIRCGFMPVAAILFRIMDENSVELLDLQFFEYGDAAE